MKRREFITALGGVVAATWPLEVWPQQSIQNVFSVYPERTFQTIVGFGAGFDETTAPLLNEIANLSDRERVYDLLYGDTGARLNIARLKISPNATFLSAVDSKISRHGWESDEHTQLTWRALQPVLKRTRPILCAVPFTPPARWKTNGLPTHGGSLQRAHYSDYAEYLVDFLLYYKHVLNTEIDVLSLQNEPGVAAPWQSCIWSGDELRDFLKILAPIVRAHGLNTQFMLSEGTAWSGAWLHIVPTLQDPEARRLIHVMASHSYGAPDDEARKEFAAASKRNGLPVWMSEMSLMFPPQPDDPGMTAALRIARYVRRDLIEASASAWIYCFAIFTAKFQGSMGLIAPPDIEGPARGRLRIPKRFWAIANFSRFVRPGWKLMQIEGPGGENVGFIDPGGNNFAIVAINQSTISQAAEYNFKDRAVGMARVFATTPHLDLQPLTVQNVNLNGFTAVLPPTSVLTFEGTFIH